MAVNATHFINRRCRHPVTRSSRLLGSKFLSPTESEISNAANYLKSGGLVAFPTETVYGLGANALNATAVERIFKAKGRPFSDPLIIHVVNSDSIDLLFDFGSGSQFNHKARGICMALSKSFWPGPLTIIFRAGLAIPPAVTANTGFVGLRAPEHQIARSLLLACNVPIAAPSANRFGHVSPTTAQHVYDDLHLSDEDIWILEDDVGRTGGCTVGIESTVCKVSTLGDVVTILRCGAVAATVIQAALAVKGLECTVVVDNEKFLRSSSSSGHTPHSSNPVTEPRVPVDGDDVAVAPGQMLKHYAPDLPTFIVEMNSLSSSVESSSSALPFEDAFVVDFGGMMSQLQSQASGYTDLSPSGCLREACTNLFQVLRDTESTTMRKQGVRRVLLPDLRASGGSEASKPKGVDVDLRQALWERLHRAASGNFVQLNEP